VRSAFGHFGSSGVNLVLRKRPTFHARLPLEEALASIHILLEERVLWVASRYLPKDKLKGTGSGPRRPESQSAYATPPEERRFCLPKCFPLAKMKETHH